MKTINLIVGASVCAIVFGGCMSLEERLASQDPSVRDAAEVELVNQSRQNGSTSERVAAINRVTSGELLQRIATESANDTEPDGKAAVAKISDENRLVTVCKNGMSEAVMLTAIEKISSKSALLDVAKNGRTQNVRVAAFKKLNDVDSLLQALVKCSAPNKPLHPKAYYEYNGATEKMPESERLSWNNFKKNAAAYSAWEKVALAEIVRKETEAAIGRKIPNTNVAINDSLLNMFVSEKADDAMLKKLVDEYGIGLTEGQVQVIKGKTKDGSVLAAIAAIADQKILMNILQGDPWKWKDEFSKISSDSVRRRASIDILRMMFHKCAFVSYDGDFHANGVRLGSYVPSNVQSRYANDYESGFSNAIVGGLNFEDVKSLFFEGKLDGVAEEDGGISYFVSKFLPAAYALRVRPLVDDRINSLKDNCSKDAAKKATYERLVYLRIDDSLAHGIPRDQKQLKMLIGELGEIELNKATVVAIAGNIRDADVADTFIASKFKIIWTGEVDAKDSLFAIWKVIPKMSPAAKQQIHEAALKKVAEFEKTGFVIGPYYLGMPYIDAVVLAEEKGGKDFGIDMTYKGLESAVKKWWDARVSWMEFSNMQEFVDCEDSCVLPQVIRQYVKKENGSAKAYDYATDIKHDAEVSSSTSLDPFSITGTNTKYKSALWARYTNRKLGVNIRYNEKAGVLQICKP